MRFDTVFLLEATMSYEREELEAHIYGIFHPEPVIGNEGPEFYEMPPSPRLKDEYGIDASYWKPHEYGSISRLYPEKGSNASAMPSVKQCHAPDLWSIS
jgi:hypothetical protein